MMTDGSDLAATHQPRQSDVMRTQKLGLALVIMPVRRKDQIRSSTGFVGRSKMLSERSMEYGRGDRRQGKPATARNSGEELDD